MTSASTATSTLTATEMLQNASLVAATEHSGGVREEMKQNGKKTNSGNLFAALESLINK